MRQTINKLLMSAVALSVMTLTACSDWTDTERLGLNIPTIDKQNPELYAQYMAALRDYKQSAHSVTFVTMPGSSLSPAQRNEHISTVPDSVDFVCLTSAANLHPTLIQEIKDVHAKGTRVVYNINYDAIETRWKAILEEEASKPQASQVAEGEVPVEPTPEPTPEEKFIKYCTEQTAMQLAYCDQFSFDGIEITYSGIAIQSLNAEKLAIYTARQQAFIAAVAAWKDANASKLLFFRGNPQNLVDTKILASCTNIIIPALTAISTDQLSYTVLKAAVQGVPTDRFLIGVTIPSVTDPTNEAGYFTGYEADGKTRVRATKGAARWVVMPAAGYTKSGIAISDAQNDYFNITLVYKNIKEAIEIMNPRSKN